MADKTFIKWLLHARSADGRFLDRFVASSYFGVARLRFRHFSSGADKPLADAHPSTLPRRDRQTLPLALGRRSSLSTDVASALGRLRASTTLLGFTPQD